MKDNIKTNLNLLKVIAAIFVITLHYLNGQIGGALFNTSVGSFNYYLSHLLESICIIAVNLFVLISGYLLIERKEIKISKILKLGWDVFFYCSLAYIIMIFFGKVPLTLHSFKNYMESIFGFWFVDIYIILYLLAPYINLLLNKLNQKQYKVLLIICFVFFSIWPTMINELTVKDAGYGIINFIFLYMIGGYLKKYEVSKKNNFIYFVLCVSATFFISLFSWRAYNYNFLTNMLSSIFFFQFFLGLKIKSSVFNMLSKHSLGVYIIHLQPLLYPYIFKSIFKCQLFYNSNYFIFHLLFTILCIYIICCLIDYLKSKTIDRFANKIIHKINYSIKV